MRQAFSILFFLLFALETNAQREQVQGTISADDSVNLSVLNIFPEEFPNVSVVFRAETFTGIPVWGLEKEDLRIKENDEFCEVLSLEPISNGTPISLGVIFDHSESMLYDDSQLYDADGEPLFTYDQSGWTVPPDDYEAPIEKAKKAIGAFVRSFDFKKDYISIIAFSSSVDVILPPSQNIEEIEGTLEGIQAYQSTAFYDAINVGLEQLEESEGIKVLVALTDGLDNASSHSLKQVVDRADSSAIPVYVIGLGNADPTSLSYLADSTSGQFYFARTPAALDTIYADISNRIQAFYELEYRSENLSSADDSREVELSFAIDSLYLVDNAATLELPETVIERLKEKEEEREYMLYGGVGVALLLVAGTILFFFSKRAGKPQIQSIYPNPTRGKITVKTNVQEGKVRVFNQSGAIVKELQLSSGNQEYDLSDLFAGMYIAVIESNGKKSQGEKFIIQK